MLSKACEYGIRAITFIAAQSKIEKRTSLKQVVKACDSPEAFTAKILQQLVRAGILKSVRGANGGFLVEVEALSRITLYQVIRAIDGEELFNGCGIGLAQCSADNPCAVHDEFIAIRKQLIKTMKETNLDYLVTKLDKGKAVLTR